MLDVAVQDLTPCFGHHVLLSENGNPEFATVMKVIKALGLKLHVEVEQH